MMRFFALYDPHHYNVWAVQEIHFKRLPTLHRYLKEIGTTSLKYGARHPGGPFCPVPHDACVTFLLQGQSKGQAKGQQ
jgi:hypothetical protein